jgi:hypothetical protein
LGPAPTHAPPDRSEVLSSPARNFRG